MLLDDIILIFFTLFYRILRHPELSKDIGRKDSNKQNEEYESKVQSRYHILKRNVISTAAVNWKCNL
jgi:hypothetical protein